MASIPGEIYGAKIFAVKIKLDDGREINLPLVQRRKAYFHDLLEVGQRNPLSYSVEHNVIMVGNVMHTPPLPGDKNYDSACGLRIDKDRADSIIESSESLVNERMIIQE